MDEFIPEDIRTLIERIEAQRGEEYQAKKRARQAEIERLSAIEKLRQDRKNELRQACDRIDAWIESFNRTAGPALWQLLGGAGSIVLYVGKFFRGEPTPVGDVVCSAHLRLGGPEAGLGNGLVYEELHKGQVTHKQSLLGAHSLWAHLHPDFVAGCDAHLAGPDAWKHVRHRLQQLVGKLTAV